MAVFDDEMLTIEQLAAFLKLKPQTIYKWAQSGKLPGAKFGKEWRFRRSAIEKWIDSQIPPVADNLTSESGARKSARRRKGSSGASRN